MFESSVITELKTKFVERSEQIDEIVALLSSNVRFRYMTISGPPRTGKSSILSTLLKDSELRYSYIDCRSCLNSRSLYEKTLEAINGKEYAIHDTGILHKEFPPVDSLNKFVALLRTALEEQHLQLLVFDHYSSDRFRDEDTLTSAMYHLFGSWQSHESSLLVVQSVATLSPDVNVASVHFGPYNASEVTSILRRHYISSKVEESGIAAYQHESVRNVWDRYSQLLVNLFYESIGQDISSMTAIADKFWYNYCEPLRNGSLNPKNHVQLARFAQNNSIWDVWTSRERSIIETGRESQQSTSSELSAISLVRRYLMIAAFLASYNSASMDRTLFSKGKSTRVPKERIGRQRLVKIPQNLLGPKAFPPERLISILHAIAPFPVDHNILLDQQIRHLIALRCILRQNSYTDLLQNGKWIVNIDFNYALKLSQSVSFELTYYLRD